MSIFAEYIWIDGSEPTPKLRSKTKVLEDVQKPTTANSYNVSIRDCTKYPVNKDAVPVWGFDGSSTMQAAGESSDCILTPVRVVRDPLRENSILVLCEVHNVFDGKLGPAKNNNRTLAYMWSDQMKDHEPWFGIEQEYTFFSGRDPLGWPKDGYPAPQGPFYCGVGADEVFGREIAEDHMQACLQAGLKLSGVNAEVMPGQWEFQIGPGDPLLISDHLWLARYLLYRISERYGVNVKLDPKPVKGDWNGAGAHTNYSTKEMRGEGGLVACARAASRLGTAVTGSAVIMGEKYKTNHFPHFLVNPDDDLSKKIDVYGTGYRDRLTGEHETCSHEHFKFGVADRTASVRIPLHVEVNGKGYIEDRRPCANIDPYLVVSYIMKITLSN